jgi:Domain of unknown function (DUF362)
MKRREFLAVTAAAATAAPWLRLTSLSSANAGGSDPSSNVIQVASDHVVRGRIVHPSMLREMIDLAVRRLTAKSKPADAWHSILTPTDTIGLKFNSSAAPALGVSRPFARDLVASLTDAGFDPKRIIAIELPDSTCQELGIQPARLGWSDENIDFGSGQDRFANYLDDITAIINIPFIKSHNIAGITCSLKNLSHAVVKHPASFHRNHCSPFVGDIVATPKVRDKLRLNLVNGLRIVFDKGPEAHDMYTWDAGIILAGTDPVAVDTIALEILNHQRYMLGLPEITSANQAIHLQAAADRGLGHHKRHRIDVTQLRV